MSNIISIIADKIMAANGMLTLGSKDYIISPTENKKDSEMTREDLEIMADIAIENKYNTNLKSEEEKSDCNNIVIQKNRPTENQ